MCNFTKFLLHQKHVTIINKCRHASYLLSFGLTEAAVKTEATAAAEAAGVFKFSEGNTGGAFDEEGGPPVL